MDPWIITPSEKVRHTEQFMSLGPINGFVTGAQSKGLMMQSGLSPMQLAQIWSLSDLNGDGKMDLNEFSIAFKLITQKLMGFEIPGTLPPSILMSIGSTTQGMATPGASFAHHPMPMSANPNQMFAGSPHHFGGVSSPLSQFSPINRAPVSGPPTSAMFSPPAAVHTAMSGLWEVPEDTQSRYTQLFHATDRARSGFMAGVQARNVLLQSSLPQPILAQIWNLSDVDKDGRLSLEEFILSGHLCNLAIKGEILPAVLPHNLIPPSFRSGGVMKTGEDYQGVGVSRSGTATPNSIASGVGDSFEERRKMNYMEGQLELEKRRQSIIQQQKEEEEAAKLAKEKEEAERKAQKEEMERKRLQEWADQRKKELEMQRQREQERCLQLKAKRDTLNQDFENMVEKGKTMTSDIADHRTKVTEVKAFIDTMRTSRDDKMEKMATLKETLKQQNVRLLKVTQDKAKLETKRKNVGMEKSKKSFNLTSDGSEEENINGSDNEDELTEFEIKMNSKQKQVEELRTQAEIRKNKLEELKEQKLVLMEAMDRHKLDLERVISACRSLYSTFDESRREIKAEKAKKMRDLTDPDYAWHEDTQISQGGGVPQGVEEQQVVIVGKDSSDEVAIVEYKALFDYVSENPDDLNFTVGDIIKVSTIGSTEESSEGWLTGDLNGKTGWFPENYTQRVQKTECLIKQDGDVEIATSVVEYEAVYAYTSEEVGDLHFEIGEKIVVEYPDANSDWLTGHIVGDESRSGLFPLNHVQLIHQQHISPTTVLPEIGKNGNPDPDKNKVEKSEVDGAEHKHPTDVVKQDDKERKKEKKHGHKKKKAGSSSNDTKTKDGDADIANTEGVKEHSRSKSKTWKKEKDVKCEKEEDFEKAKIISDYVSTSKQQLNLQKDEIIKIKKKTDSGWWQGETIPHVHGEKAKKGWFPASYALILTSDTNTDEVQGIDEQFEVETTAKPFPEQTDTMKKRKKKKNKEKIVKEKNSCKFVKSLFPFDGQHLDELSFSEGQIIKLNHEGEMQLSTNADWLTGHIFDENAEDEELIENKIFPANYTQPLTEVEEQNLSESCQKNDQIEDDLC